MPGPGDRLERIDTGILVGDVVDAERHPEGGFRLLAVAEIKEAIGPQLCLNSSKESLVKLQPITYPAGNFL